jgi:hypothetical protein
MSTITGHDRIIMNCKLGLSVLSIFTNIYVKGLLEASITISGSQYLANTSKLLVSGDLCTVILLNSTDAGNRTHQRSSDHLKIFRKPTFAGQLRKTRTNNTKQAAPNRIIRPYKTYKNLNAMEQSTFFLRS